MNTKLSLFAIIIAAFAFGGISQTASANPPTGKPVTNAPVQYSQAIDPARVPSTMNNYWNANEWDREGAAAFWHATEDNRPVRPAATTSKRAKKGSRLVKKLFNR